MDSDSRKPNSRYVEQDYDHVFVSTSVFPYRIDKFVDSPALLCLLLHISLLTLSLKSPDLHFIVSISSPSSLAYLRGDIYEGLDNNSIYSVQIFYQQFIFFLHAYINY